MQTNAPAPDRDSLQGYPSADPIRAELSGNNSCTALGITVRAKAPVLALCRKLIAAGHDPGRPLHAYRGETLALTVTAIGYGAKYTVLENRQFGPILLRLAPEMTATLRGDGMRSKVTAVEPTGPCALITSQNDGCMQEIIERSGEMRWADCSGEWQPGYALSELGRALSDAGISLSDYQKMAS